MKHITILFLLLGFNIVSKAQQFNLLGGVQASSSGNVSAGLTNSSYAYDGKIEGGFRWTAGVEFILRSGIGLELSNYNQQTTAIINKYGLNPEQALRYNEKLNWLMFKANKYVNLKTDKLSFFGGTGLGLASFSTPDMFRGAKDDSFAFQLQAGLQFWPTKALGLKLSSEYQMAVQGSGLAFTSLVSNNNKIENSKPFSQFSGGISLVLNMNKLSAKQ